MYDRDYWFDLINFEKLIDMGLISADNLKMMYFFKDMKDGVEYLRPRMKDLMKYIEIYHEV
jgi:predicted Rossmann-fold nucleotide-binding protein